MLSREYLCRREADRIGERKDFPRMKNGCMIVVIVCSL